MLDDELAALETPTTQPAAPDEQVQADKQRHELAKQVLAQAMTTFTATQTALQADKIDEAKPLIDRGVEEVETLRRLFFSIVEHLKETAQRQAQLMDDTRDAATLDTTPAEPLAGRQKELLAMSRKIAESLEAQSQQGPPPAGNGHPGQDPGASQEAAGQLLQAAKTVDQAADAMDDAAGKIEADPPELKNASDPQKTALQKLIEAIALLEPPQQQQQQQQKQQQKQAQQGQDQSQEDKQKQQQQQQQMDLRHLLQSVRDRAAQRQEDRRHEPAGYQPVEKDW